MPFPGKAKNAVPLPPRFSLWISPQPNKKSQKNVSTLEIAVHHDILLLKRNRGWQRNGQQILRGLCDAKR